jgi:hypothetical protein
MWNRLRDARCRAGGWGEAHLARRASCFAAALREPGVAALGSRTHATPLCTDSTVLPGAHLKDRRPQARGPEKEQARADRRVPTASLAPIPLAPLKPHPHRHLQRATARRTAPCHHIRLLSASKGAPAAPGGPAISRHAPLSLGDALHQRPQPTRPDTAAPQRRHVASLRARLHRAARDRPRHPAMGARRQRYAQPGALQRHHAAGGGPGHARIQPPDGVLHVGGRQVPRLALRAKAHHVAAAHRGDGPRPGRAEGLWAAQVRRAGGGLRGGGAAPLLALPAAPSATHRRRSLPAGPPSALRCTGWRC